MRDFVFALCLVKRYKYCNYIQLFGGWMLWLKRTKQ
nr:MAG TPA_asm: hypothetical protein [Caudoviricetes sp.]